MLKLSDIQNIREDLEMGWHVWGLIKELVAEKESRLDSSVRRLKRIEGTMTTNLLKKQQEKRKTIKRKGAK